MSRLRIYENLLETILARRFSHRRTHVRTRIVRTIINIVVNNFIASDIHICELSAATAASSQPVIIRSYSSRLRVPFDAEDRRRSSERRIVRNLPLVTCHGI